MSDTALKPVFIYLENDCGSFHAYTPHDESRYADYFDERYVLASAVENSVDAYERGWNDAMEAVRRQLGYVPQEVVSA